MAFPTLGSLDTFNAGATQALTARTGWGAVVIAGTTTYTTNGAPTLAEILTATGGNYWNTSAEDSEAWVVMGTWTPASNTFSVAARIQAVGASPTYYSVRLANSGTTDFRIYKTVAGVSTALGTNTATTVIAGDSVGIEVIGTSISSYYKSGAGAWGLKETITDSSITGSGFVGGFRNHIAITQRVDEFGGGALVAADVDSYARFLRRGLGPVFA